VNGVSFALNGDGGVLATVTTTAAHGYRVGQPVRFADNADLAAAMCPSLEAGSVLCGQGLSATWLPVESVPSARSFTLRIGNAVKAGGTDPAEAEEVGPVVPAPWPTATPLGVVGAGGIGAAATALPVVESGSAPPTGTFAVLVGDAEQGYERMTVTRRSSDGEGGSGFTYTVARAVHGPTSPASRSSSRAARASSR
jgi:hypothetical protein